MKASYKYQAEDVDELAFDVGEIVNVVEYDDPEDQVEHRLLFSIYTLFVAVDVVIVEVVAEMVVVLCYW